MVAGGDGEAVLQAKRTFPIKTVKRVTVDRVCPMCKQPLVVRYSLFGRWNGAPCRYIMTCERCQYDEPLSEKEFENALCR